MNENCKGENPNPLFFPHPNLWTLSYNDFGLFIIQKNIQIIFNLITKFISSFVFSYQNNSSRYTIFFFVVTKESFEL